MAFLLLLLNSFLVGQRRSCFDDLLLAFLLLLLNSFLVGANSSPFGHLLLIWIMECVTPKGALRPAVCHASATREGS